MNLVSHHVHSTGTKSSIFLKKTILFYFNKIKYELFTLVEDNVWVTYCLCCRITKILERLIPFNPNPYHSAGIVPFHMGRPTITWCSRKPSHLPDLSLQRGRSRGEENQGLRSQVWLKYLLILFLSCLLGRRSPACPYSAEQLLRGGTLTQLWCVIWGICKTVIKLYHSKSTWSTVMDFIGSLKDAMHSVKRKWSDINTCRQDSRGTFERDPIMQTITAAYWAHSEVVTLLLRKNGYFFQEVEKLTFCRSYNIQNSGEVIWYSPNKHSCLSHNL